VKLGVLSFFLVAPLVYLTFATAGQIWQRQEHPMFETIKERGAGTSAALSLVSAAFAAPVAEELLFRGVLLGWLTTVAAAGALRTGRIRSAVGGEIFKDATGEVLVLEYDDLAVPIELHTEPRLAQKLDWKATWIPNILVSLLFAGMHYAQWPSPVALFPLSLALGWLAHRTGRITASIVLHAAFNGFSTTMLLLVTQAGLPTGP
jgi:membrane protease YdiL (CAAX protease family)